MACSILWYGLIDGTGSIYNSPFSLLCPASFSGDLDCNGDSMNSWKWLYGIYYDSIVILDLLLSEFPLCDSNYVLLCIFLVVRVCLLADMMCVSVTSVNLKHYVSPYPWNGVIYLYILHTD